MSWSANHIPSQAGRLVVITGASGGLGLETARALVAKGASVVVAARNIEKGEAAIEALGPRARFEQLDLASLSSIRAFSGNLTAAGQPINVLINNAGLAAPPNRLETKDGFELQFGTNFLGHFLLTVLLLPLLREANKPRVVTVTSLVEKGASIDLDDPNWTRRYSPIQSYAASKLANLLFAQELQRRSDVAGWNILSIAAHPGVAMTELTKARPGQAVLGFNWLVDLISPLIGHSSERGALPILFAATSLGVAPGSYYGPQGWNEMRGPPGPVRGGPHSQDRELARNLWRLAEELTQTVF